MNILKLAAQIFLIYLLYKLVVNVIIPIYRQARTIKSQFKEMQSHMQEQMQNDPRRTNYNSQAPKQPATPEDDEYIDYEEVK